MGVVVCDNVWVLVTLWATRRERQSEVYINFGWRH